MRKKFFLIIALVLLIILALDLSRASWRRFPVLKERVAGIIRKVKGPARFTPEEWQAFYKKNPDFLATDEMLLELERKAENKRITLDEAWEELKKEK